MANVSNESLISYLMFIHLVAYAGSTVYFPSSQQFSWWWLSFPFGNEIRNEEEEDDEKNGKSKIDESQASDVSL